jgi:hypothetical protein
MDTAHFSRGVPISTIVFWSSRPAQFRQNVHSSGVSGNIRLNAVIPPIDFKPTDRADDEHKCEDESPMQLRCPGSSDARFERLWGMTAPSVRFAQRREHCPSGAASQMVLVNLDALESKRKRSIQESGSERKGTCPPKCMLGHVATAGTPCPSAVGRLDQY